MNFSDFLRRAKSSLKFWSATAPAATDVPEFRMEEVSERAARLQAPQAMEPQQFHALVKLAPIPVPREVRRESQMLYLGAWAGTAALAWGSFYVPTDWLLWYGVASVVIFAMLFRMEGPRTRAERMQREAEVARCLEAYQQAEAHLRTVLSEGFNERMEAFNQLRAEYDRISRALGTSDPSRHSKLLAILTNPQRTGKTQEEQMLEQMAQMERRLLQLLDELEDYSDIHKDAIDAAIMARHNARLAYWQAKLDEAALTGEAVQQH